ERGAPGDRALLFYESGIDFPLAYFGCLYAGMIPVPVPPPRRGKLRQSTHRIVQDCSPRFAFAAADRLPGLREELGASVLCATTEELRAGAAEDLQFQPPPDRTEVAHLQYTSGSTSAPKGIRVTHRSVLANVEQAARRYGSDRASTHVSWLPLYHDMGLVLNLLEAAYLGALCVLVEPIQFIHRPASFLWAIHDHRAQVAGGPNFLYDHCVARFKAAELEGLNLSSWKVAINGAEPVRARTLERFAATFAPHGFEASAMNPGYGMAEATLVISAGRRGEGVHLQPISKKALQEDRIAAPESEADRFPAVACGHAVDGGRVAIVDPVTRRRRPEDGVGEIWIGGPHVADGYWNNEAATEETFRARTDPDGDGPFLRSGDLGFVREGRVYIAGRMKDVIIIRGGNYYPQDIEGIVERCHPALRPNFSAAFGVLHDGEERLVVVQEVDRAAEPALQLHPVAEAIRKAISQELGLMVTGIALIRQGTIPKTSSGKIQRSAARRQYLDRTLDEIDSTESVPLRAAQPAARVARGPPEA
ncbi:MAG TPA: fatty acyl-AMP ligase, partial [Myxococcales bacterium]|nr:fatty acyl-AMP ligase [Myxococcales bacterium]